MYDQIMPFNTLSYYVGCAIYLEVTLGVSIDLYS